MKNIEVKWLLHDQEDIGLNLTKAENICGITTNVKNIVDGKQLHVTFIMMPIFIDAKRAII